MSKCLITKLNGICQNENLLHIGEMRIHFDKVDVPSDGTQCIGIDVKNPTKLEIVGDGYFTDKTLTENKGKTMLLNPGLTGIWVSNNDVDIAVLDKYSITILQNFYPGQPGNTVSSASKHINLEDLKFSKGLWDLNIPDNSINGDISALKELPELSRIILYKSNITGNIKNLGGLKELNYINLAETNVSGNINDLSNLTKMTYLNLNATKYPLEGSIDSFARMTELGFLYLSDSMVTGDLAKLPAKCSFIELSNYKGTSFSWSTRTSSKILAIMGNAKLDNVDKMLQDQSLCEVGFTSNQDAVYKTIAVRGTRTSASDAAVATLQQKGYTVSVNPA